MQIRARFVTVSLLLLAAALVAGGAVSAPKSTVASVTDGDTLRLRSGQRVRLVQIDAPERAECYYQEARAELLRLAPLGSSVALEADTRLDQVDRFGRLLRYVKRGTVNVNLELVRRGAAVPYFFDGDRGRYAGQLLAAERTAKSARRGVWGACRGEGAPVPLVPGCDPNYAGACVPPYPPDRDCGELRDLGLDLPVRVVGSDPHRLDADGDRLGCE
jgi:micrococcal nuclease